MFDRYVAAQKGGTARRRLQLLVIVSVVAHAAFVVGLIVWSFVHVAEVAAPLLTVTFFNAAAPPPPPPPPPPAGKKKVERKPRPTLTQPREVKPLVQPKEPEKPEPEDDKGDDGEKGGKEGGVAGGVEGGVVGGVVGSPTPPPPPAPPAPKPKMVAYAPDLSEFTHRPDPHLPDALKIQRKGTGDVDFFAVVCVDMAGNVTDVRIKLGIPGADEGVSRTLRTWRLKPQPIPICFPFRVTFQID